MNSGGEVEGQKDRRGPKTERQKERQERGRGQKRQKLTNYHKYTGVQGSVCMFKLLNNGYFTFLKLLTKRIFFSWKSNQHVQQQQHQREERKKKAWKIRS